MFFYAVSFLAIFLLLFHIDILNFISNVISSLSMCKHVALVALLALTYFARFQIKIIIKSLIWPQIASLEKLIIYFRLELIKINHLIWSHFRYGTMCLNCFELVEAPIELTERIFGALSNIIRQWNIMKWRPLGNWPMVTFIWW